MSKAHTIDHVRNSLRMGRLPVPSPLAGWWPRRAGCPIGSRVAARVDGCADGDGAAGSGTNVLRVPDERAHRSRVYPRSAHQDCASRV